MQRFVQRHRMPDGTGMGGDVKPLVQTARSGRPIIALDGCPLHCAAKVLERQGLQADKHVDLSDLGVPKRKHEDFDPRQAAQVFEQLITDPLLPGCPNSPSELAAALDSPSAPFGHRPVQREVLVLPPPLWPRTGFRFEQTA